MKRKVRPPRIADSYMTTVRPRHKDVIPSTGTRAIEPHYVSPPGLNLEQQALVDECASFLTDYEISVLKAKLLGGIKELDGFTDDKVRAVQERALKRGIDLH